MSVESTLLALTPRPDNYPDFAGQFLHTVGEALITAMYENNAESVTVLFNLFLNGSVLQFQKLRPKGDVTDWRGQIEIKIAVAPLLDLLDLSGYSYLYAEYHNNPALSEPVVTTWDAYLKDENAEAPKSKVQFLAAAVALTESGFFELAHRGVLRTGWGQLVSHRFQDLERKEVLSRGQLYHSESIVLHTSPLVRIFAREPYGSFHDGIDIFLIKYIRQRGDGKDVDFGARRRDLQEELEWEEKHYAEALRDGEDEI